MDFLKNLNANKQFEIKKPEFQKHYLITLIFKYLVLSFITCIGELIVTLFYIRSFLRAIENRNLALNLLLFISTIATILVYLRFFLRKYKLSNIYNVSINFDEKIIEFKSISNYKDEELNKKINFQDLSFTYKITYHPLFGKQRIFTFFDKSRLYNILNIDLTSWNRLENIDEFIGAINEINKFS